MNSRSFANVHFISRLLAAVALSLAATACSDKDAGQGQAPGATGESMQSTMNDCDMQGMDMSKMSAEEHSKMMEECKTRPSPP